MDRCKMNNTGCRPYNRTCGMIQPVPGTVTQDTEMYSHLQYLEPAMAYVPYQNLTNIFNLDYALSVGTIFPQLYKPFCGKRGMCR